MFPAFLEFDHAPVLLSVLLFLLPVFYLPLLSQGSGGLILAVGLAAVHGMHTTAPPSRHLARRVSSNPHKENLPKGKGELIPTPYMVPQAG